MSRPIELCSICNLPETEHGTGKVIHEFARPGQSLKLGKQADEKSSHDDHPVDEGRPRQFPTGDPVLRMLMIRKGLITPQDLTDLEAELKGAGIAYHDPESLG